MSKLKKLKNILSQMQSVLVAYSGGGDSTFLLKTASLVLPPDKILTVTAVSATYPSEELAFSRKMAKAFGLRHRIIKTRELKDKRFVANPQNRCYFCKKELFAKLARIARKENINFVLDASNVSDEKDFRPGSKARQELGVRSPLKEAGFTKEDIRKTSKKIGLISWDKPALACLASRIPYGTRISNNILVRINKAENFLKTLKLKQVRLRHYNGLCRIEVLQADIPRLMSKRNLIVERLKSLGYNYITLDLEGYRTGSLNEILK